MKKIQDFYNQIKNNKRMFVYSLTFAVLLILIFSTFAQFIFGKIIFGLLPFFVGLFLAAIINPLVEKTMARTNWSRKRSSLLTFFSVQAILILLIYLLWQPISHDFFIFLERINSSEFIVNIAEQYNKIFGVDNGYSIILSVKNNIINYFTINTSNLIVSFGGTFASIILTMMAAFAIAVYILIDYPKYRQFLGKVFPKGSKFHNFNKDWGLGFRAWIKGWSIDQLFICVCSSTLLFFTGVESWITLTIIMTLFNFVPFIGPIVGGLGVSIYVLAMYIGETMVIGPFGLYNLSPFFVILAVFIGVTIIQTIESVYIVPNVYSHVASINPVAILTGLSVIGLLISPFLTPLTIPILIFIRILISYF